MKIKYGIKKFILLNLIFILNLNSIFTYATGAEYINSNTAGTSSKGSGETWGTAALVTIYDGNELKSAVALIDKSNGAKPVLNCTNYQNDLLLKTIIAKGYNLNWAIDTTNQCISTELYTCISGMFGSDTNFLHTLVGMPTTVILSDGRTLYGFDAWIKGYDNSGNLVGNPDERCIIIRSIINAGKHKSGRKMTESANWTINSTHKFVDFAATAATKFNAAKYTNYVGNKGGEAVKSYFLSISGGAFGQPIVEKDDSEHKDPEHIQINETINEQMILFEDEMAYNYSLHDVGGKLQTSGQLAVAADDNKLLRFEVSINNPTHIEVTGTDSDGDNEETVHCSKEDTLKAKLTINLGRAIESIGSYYTNFYLTPVGDINNPSELPMFNDKDINSTNLIADYTNNFGSIWGSYSFEMKEALPPYQFGSGKNISLPSASENNLNMLFEGFRHLQLDARTQCPETETYTGIQWNRWYLNRIGLIQSWQTVNHTGEWNKLNSGKDGKLDDREFKINWMGGLANIETAECGNRVSAGSGDGKNEEICNAKLEFENINFSPINAISNIKFIQYYEIGFPNYGLELGPIQNIYHSLGGRSTTLVEATAHGDEADTSLDDTKHMRTGILN